MSGRAWLGVSANLMSESVREGQLRLCLAERGSWEPGTRARASINLAAVRDVGRDWQGLAKRPPPSWSLLLVQTGPGPNPHPAPLTARRLTALLFPNDFPFLLSLFWVRSRPLSLTRPPKVLWNMECFRPPVFRCMSRTANSKNSAECAVSSTT